MKIIQYRHPPKVGIWFGPHTFECITIRIPLRTFLSFRNDCQCFFPNWQALHTPKIRSLVTTPFHCPRRRNYGSAKQYNAQLAWTHHSSLECTFQRIVPYAIRKHTWLRDVNINCWISWQHRFGKSSHGNMMKGPDWIAVTGENSNTTKTIDWDTMTNTIKTTTK